MPVSDRASGADHDRRPFRPERSEILQRLGLHAESAARPRWWADFREGLLLVVGAALVVLLITCANVAGLQFVRASTRQREVAIRLALGASRTAIAREHLIESFLLVALGGIGGVLIGSWGLDLLLASLARRLDSARGRDRAESPGAFRHRRDGVVYRPCLRPVIRPGARPKSTRSIRCATEAKALPACNRSGCAARSSSRRSRSRMVLLVCAGLVWKSFAAITRVNPGIQIEKTLSMVLTLAPTRYDTRPKRTDYYRQVLERVSARAGRRRGGVHPDDAVHLGNSRYVLGLRLPDDAAKLPPAFYDSVSPSYFSDDAHSVGGGPDLCRDRRQQGAAGRCLESIGRARNSSRAKIRSANGCCFRRTGSSQIQRRSK